MDDPNRAWWDERVALHADGDFYDVEGFKAGQETLRPFELEEVGDVRGRSLVHLQCHFGLDTLSWARHGATVTGLDYSAAAIERARALAAEIGMSAEFVEANVYDAVEALGQRRFEIVYTGIGALCWLPDLDGWARVVAELLEPGGMLYLSEIHPIADVYADDDLTLEYDYFSPGPFEIDAPGSYSDREAATEQNQTVNWLHPLADVVNALIGAGLQLRELREHDRIPFPRFPFLVEREYRLWSFPEGTVRFPLMYSLRARKPY